MTLTDAERHDEISAALADAGYSEDQVRFYALDDLRAGANAGAAWYRPRLRIPDDDRHFVNDTLRLQANSLPDRDRHRVIVPAHPSTRVEFAALLRHELEHARQFDSVGPSVFDLQDFIENDVLVEVAGGLDGCAGYLINTVPTELDCNAAASVYIANRFSADEVEALRCGHRRFLACALLPPADYDTLAVRMLAHLFVHKAAVECHAARRGFSVPKILDSVMPGAADVWRRFDSQP